jgi:hypothetical protein
LHQGLALPPVYTSDSSIEMKIDAVTEGLGTHIANRIRRISKDNIVSIIDFNSSVKLEINISYYHRENYIKICTDYPNSVTTNLSGKSQGMM